MDDFAAAWMTPFLAGRHLSRPDSRWLYAYQMTELEFGALGDALRVLTSSAPVSHVRQYRQHFDAMFVAFAAEWWRRSFAGGPWKWTPILDALGIDAHGWAQVDRQTAVVRGLKFWGHAPGAIGLAYLGAIAAQGGLPTRVIAESRGPLAQLLSRLLRKAARLNLASNDIATVIRNDPHGLPASLGQDEVIQLIAHMIESILQLRSQFKLAGHTDPVRELDRQHPDWRRDFPLQLEDAAAKALLDMLVGEAARAQIVSISRPVVVRRFLHEAGEDELQLHSNVEVQPRIPARVLEHWAGPARTPLPGVLLLDAVAGRRQLVAVTSLRPGQEADRCYRAEVKRPTWEGADAAREHLLYVRAGLEEIARIPIPRGESLDPALPWTFVRREDVWELAACGSTSLAAAEALILLPANARLVGSGLEEPQRALLVGVERRTSALVRGEVQVHCDGEGCFRIRVGETGAEPPDLTWEGLRLWIDSRPELVFLGMPRLARCDGDGNRQYVNPRRIVDDSRVPIASTTVGRFRACLLNDAIVEQSWNLIVLPVRAGIDYRPVNPRGGTITLRHWGIEGAAVTTAEVTASISRTADGVTLQLQAEAAPPDVVSIEVWWDDPSRTLQVTFPFPARGVRLIDARGVDLSTHRTISRHALVGMRLRLFEPVPTLQSTYTVILSLRDARSGLKAARQHRPKFDHGMAEYRLLDFKDQMDEFFSFTDDIDARIEILVTQGGSICARLLVTRSDAAVELREGWLRVVDDAGRLDCDGDAIDAPVAVDLACPEKAAMNLDPAPMDSGTGSAWDVTALRNAPGLWMIASAMDDAIAIRPLLFPVPPIEVPPDTDGNRSQLVQAVCESDVKERGRRIDDALQRLGESLGDPDWKPLAAYAAQLAHLPLGAFDLWRRVAHRPALAANLLLQPWAGAARDRAITILRRFDRELPFLWESISMRTWREAAVRTREWLIGQIADDLADEVLTGLIDQGFAQAPRTIGDLGALLAFTVVRTPSASLQGRAIEILREGTTLARAAQQRLWRDPSSLYQTLLQRRLDQVWPEESDFEFAMRAAHEAYKEAYPALATLLQGPREMPAHRFAVTYLPLVLAIEAVMDAREGIASSPARVLTARMMRSFDPGWFEDAFIYALRICIALTNTPRPI